MYKRARASTVWMLHLPNIRFSGSFGNSKGYRLTQFFRLPARRRAASNDETVTPRRTRQSGTNAKIRKLGAGLLYKDVHSHFVGKLKTLTESLNGNRNIGVRR
jgi:hypothetical protein